MRFIPETSEGENEMTATTMKMVFWGVFAAGFLACTVFGIGPVLKRVGGEWTSPWMLAGVALGVAIVALAVAFVTGFRPGVLGTDTQMVVALVVLIGAKVGVAAAQVAVSAVGRG
jgi:hypothetical protein